jgi:hypothetical protein
MITMRASGRAAATVSTPAFRKGSLAPPLAEECVQPRLDSSWQGEQLGVWGRPPLIQHEPTDIRGQRRPAEGTQPNRPLRVRADRRRRTPGDQGSHHPARPGGAELVAQRRPRAGARRPGRGLDELPPHLVVGTGAHGRMRPDPTTLQQLWERGVTVETLPTGQVVRRFAALDPAGTAAALHLTC